MRLDGESGERLWHSAFQKGGSSDDVCANTAESNLQKTINEFYNKSKQLMNFIINT